MIVTGRQMDHLRMLSDGSRHRPVRGATSMSCYTALVRKGLADVDLLQGTIGFRISEAGRVALNRAPQETGIDVLLSDVGGSGT